MMINAILAILLLSLSSISCFLNETHRDLSSESPPSERIAFIMTLAGPNKLAPYFEWTCKTFGLSAPLYDLLVFHEDNLPLQHVKCPSNVKFVDLGEKGLSRIIVEEVLKDKDMSRENREELLKIVNEIIKRCPRYLVEVKPIFGTLFADYLKPYSHWSYTDPDIIWGDLNNWIEESDLKEFNYISIAKNMDAGRLFLRGQVISPKFS